MRLTDTSPEAERVLAEIHRRMTPAEKWARLGDMYDLARILHASGVRHRNPAATAADIRRAWITVNLGPDLAAHVRGDAVEQNRANLKSLRVVIQVLERLDIPYAVGGSLASSLHGKDRFTQDADVTVEPFGGKESQLVDLLQPDHYVSLPAVQEAVRDQSSFNIINNRTAFKVDVFVRKDNPFEQSAMSRRQTVCIDDVPEHLLQFHSPEDTILFKLKWFRLGNEVSDRQWNDVLEVLKIQAARLDDTYLDRWAPDVGVADLLEQARQEAKSQLGLSS